MPLLILIAIFLAIILVVYSLVAGESGLKGKKQAVRDGQPSSESTEMINSLNTKLKKAELDYIALQNELNEVKKIKSDLNEKLEETKGAPDQPQNNLQILQAENDNLKDRLIAKDKEMKAQREKIQSLEAENKKLGEERKNLPGGAAAEPESENATPPNL